jgi:hypothetical protein
MPNRSCHRLLRWLKRAALRSKSKSKQRYKMFLEASASSSPSKSPMQYAHTDGGVSAIRCLDQSVDEPPDSPALLRVVPSRHLPKPLLPELRSPRSSQSWQNSQQPRTFEHRLLLFLLTERGLNEDFLTSVCEHCEILGWFAPVHIDLNSDLLSLTTLGSVKLVVS